MVLAKDVFPVCVTRADLFFAMSPSTAEEHVSVVTCDEEGVIRLYAYDPRGKFASFVLIPGLLMHEAVDPESKNGQRLLRRTEFHTHTEYRSSYLIARRAKASDEVPQSKLICGMFLRGAHLLAIPHPTLRRTR